MSKPLDPRIGTLNSGVYYAYDKGYDVEPTMGTLAEVEAALGINQETPSKAPSKPAKPAQMFRAKLTSPDGQTTVYEVFAYSKTEARKLVRAHYREDVPSPRYGFFSFEQQSLEWLSDER